MSSVDERIVRMQFDNAQFEAATRVTMQTLEKLKSALKLDKAGQAFDNVTKAAEQVDLAALQNGVNTVADRFSTLGIIGMTALQNITNAAVNAGAQMIKSLTIDPINQGFGEYELKMGSVQTIMASTGADLDTVNGYLEQLNTYADKTIYSFSDMTNSIGKFTNAGVDLDTAVKAIQGISNEAALSGANANEASRAMYNFSQALSAGAVKLIDWKSIENANMATKEFKNELIKTAVKVGTLTKAEGGYISTTTDANGHVSELFNSTKNFNNSLSAQWMTTEVLTKTLSRYADENTKLGRRAFAAAQDVKTFSQMMDTLKEAVGSGWSQTFELIFGNFNEAKELWTGVANAIGGVIDRTSSARNELLKTWKTIGGRDAMIRGFANIWTGLLSVLKPIKEAFGDIFGSIQPRALKNLSRGFAVFTKQLIVTGKTARNIKDTFKVLFAILKVPVTILKTLAKLIAPILSLLMKVGGILFSITGFISRLILGVGNVVSNFIKFLDIGGRVEKVGKAITGAFDAVANAISEAFTSFKNLSAVKALTSSFQKIGSSLGKSFKTLGQSAKTIFDNIFTNFTSNASGYLTGGIKSLTEWVGSLIEKAKGVKSLSNLVNSFTGLFDKLATKASNFANTVAETGGKVIVERWAKIRDSVATTFNKIKQIPAVQSAVSLVGKVLGDIASFALDKISGFLDKLAAFDFSTLVTNVATFFTNIYKSEAAQTLLAALVEVFEDLSVKADEAKVALKNTWDTFKSDTGARIDKVVEFLKEFALACKDVHSASDLLDVVKQHWDKLVDSFKNLEPIKKFTDTVTKLKNLFTGKAKTAGAGVSGFFKSLVDTVKNIDFIKLAKGLLRTSIAIRLIISSINSIRLNNQIVGVLKQVRQVFSGMQHEMNANALIKVAGAVAIFVGAIIAIAYNADKIWAAKGVIAAVFLVVVAFIGIVAYISSKLGGGEAESASEALGDTIKKLTGTLKLFGRAAAFAMASAGVLMLAIAVKKIIEALKEIGDFDPKVLLENLDGVATVVFAMIGLAIVSRLAGKYAASFGIGVLALAYGIKLLLEDIQDIANLNLTKEQALKVAGVISAAGLILTVLGGLASRLTAFSDFKGMLGFAAMFVGLAYGMKIMIQSMELVGKLDDATIKKSLGVFAVLSILASVLMAASKNAKGVKAGPILALAVLIGVIALSLWGLSEIDWKKLAASALALGGVMAALGFVAMQLKDMKIGGALVGAGVLAGLVVVIALVLYKLDELEVDSALTNATAISEVLLACTAAIAILGRMPLAAGLTAAWNFVTFVGVIGGVFGGIGAVVNELDTNGKTLKALDTGIQIVEKVGEMIGAFIGGIAVGALDQIDTMGTSLKRFAESMDYFMYVFEKHDGQAVSQTAQGLADALVALIGANFLDNIASFFGGENGQIDDFGAKLKTFGEALVTYANTVSELKTDAIDKSVTAAEKLTALSDQVHNGGVIGFWVGDSDLDTFGRNLVTFGNALTTFSSKTSNLDTSKFSEIAEATEPLITLTDKVHNGGVIGFWVGDSDLDTFGTNLVSFGSGLGSFSRSISEIENLNQFKSVASAVDPLISLTDKIKNGGVIGFWVGNSDLDTFGVKLESFGANLAKYSDSVSAETVNLETVENSAKVAGVLADVALAISEIPSGSLTLGNFSGSLASFGAQLKNYGENISGISESIVTDSLRAKNAMVHIVECAIAVKDASEGGIFKDTSLGEFSGFLEPFGAAMEAYSLAIAGIDDGVVQNTNTASASLKTLAHAAEEIPNTSGLAGLLGGTDIGTFADGMKTFGGAFKRYSRSIAGMDKDVVANTQNASEALKTIANAANDIPNSGGLAGIFSGNNDVGVFGDQLKNFGSAMKAFTDELANVSYDNIDKTVQAVKDLSGMASSVAGIDTYTLTGFAMSLKQMAADGLSGFTDSFATGAAKIRVQVKSFVAAITNIVKQGDLAPAGKSLINSLVNGMRDNLNTVKTMGSTVVSNFSQGVVAAAPGASSAGASLVRNAASGAQSANSSPSFYDIGRNLGEGLRLGINSKQYEVYRAGYELGKKGAQGAKDGSKERSPSKLTIEVGEYLGEGLVIGMNSYADKVERSGYALGSKAASAVDMMVMSIMDAVETDAVPVITPVLDLSQIQNGTQTINGMLTAQTVSFNAANAQISALSSTLNQASLEADQNQRIVDELGKLRGDITTMGNRMRNLQVVMDSGELVGSITDKVDRSLGIKYA